MRDLPAGKTRDCIDPWTNVEIRVDGLVAPCCIRPPIGNLLQDDLASILANDSYRTLRAELLQGRVDAICRTCNIRAFTDPLDLQEKVKALMQTEVPAAPRWKSLFQRRRSISR